MGHTFKDYGSTIKSKKIHQNNNCKVTVKSNSSGLLHYVIYVLHTISKISIAVKKATDV